MARFMDVTIYREVVETKTVRVRLPDEPEFTEESIVESVWNQEPIDGSECWRVSDRTFLQRNEVGVVYPNGNNPCFDLVALDGNLVPKLTVEHIKSAKATLDKAGYRVKLPHRLLKVKPTPVVEEDERLLPEGFDEEEVYYQVEQALRDHDEDMAFVDKAKDDDEGAYMEFLLRVFHGEEPYLLAQEYGFTKEE